MTPNTFRQAFPEFASTSDYRDGQITFWMTLAGNLLNADRWGDMLDLGTMLYVAHHLALGTRDQQTAQAGGVPGMVNGPQSAKAVDKVSASYDTGAVALEGGGFWNSTMYGIQFLQLARYAGAGGVQM